MWWCDGERYSGGSGVSRSGNEEEPPALARADEAGEEPEEKGKDVVVFIDNGEGSGLYTI
jgi:hypothetical protein